MGLQKVFRRMGKMLCVAKNRDYFEEDKINFRLNINLCFI